MRVDLHVAVNTIGLILNVFVKMASSDLARSSAFNRFC